MPPTAETPKAILHGPRARDPWFYGWRMVKRHRDDGTEYRERVPLTEWDVLHPQEEYLILHNNAHDINCFYLKAVFQWRLKDRPNTLVLHDHRIDWQTAGLTPHGPDVTVLFHSQQPWDNHRGTYHVRDFGATPVLVVEVTSPSTRDCDLNEKVTEYCLAGVQQYVIADSRETEMGHRIYLLCYRPSPEGPVREILKDPNRIWLPALDLWLVAKGDKLSCELPDGTAVGDFTATMEAMAREKLRAEQESKRAEEERQRAEQESQRAEEEREKRIAVEQRLKELEAELQRLRGA